MSQNRDKAIQLLDGLARYAGLRAHIDSTHANPYFHSKPAWRLGIMSTVCKGLDEQLGLQSHAEQAFIDLYTGYKVSAKNGMRVLPEPPEQRDAIQRLRRLANWAFAQQTEDAGNILFATSDCLEDICTSLVWDVDTSGIYRARDTVENLCFRHIAQQPIAFTRILVGGDFTPGASVFEAGYNTTPEFVVGNDIFEKMCAEHPDISIWPTMCTAYRGGPQNSQTRLPNADELRFMNQLGDEFLSEIGVHHVGGPYYSDIPSTQESKIDPTMEM